MSIDVTLRITTTRPPANDEAEALGAAIERVVGDLRDAGPGPENDGYPGVTSASVVDWTEGQGG